MAAEYRNREKEIIADYFYDISDPGRYNYNYVVEEIDMAIIKNREEKIKQILD